MPVYLTNSDTVIYIIDMMLCLNYRILDDCGQFCDVYSTMTVNKNGAQNKKLNEKCLLMHCYCHSLNPAVWNTIKNIPSLKYTLDMAYEISTLIRKSLKREVEFHRKKEESVGPKEHDFHVYDMDTPTLEILCPTRWTLQAASLCLIQNKEL